MSEHRVDCTAEIARLLREIGERVAGMGLLIMELDRRERYARAEAETAQCEAGDLRGELAVERRRREEAAALVAGLTREVQDLRAMAARRGATGA